MINGDSIFDRRHYAILTMDLLVKLQQVFGGWGKSLCFGVKNGISMGYLWEIYGKSMGNIVIYGKSMGHS